MNISDEQKVKALSHIRWEIEMFHFTQAQLVNDRHSGKLKNALLESFLIHVRNLHVFFKKKIRKEDFHDDVLAQEDFGFTVEKEQQWTNKRKIDKHLSHITYERTGDEHPEWNISRIGLPYLKLCVGFISELKAGNLNVDLKRISTDLMSCFDMLHSAMKKDLDKGVTLSIGDTSTPAPTPFVNRSED